MLYNYDSKTLLVKIVYYGPALSGKTESIKSLFSHFNKEKQLTSIDTTSGRTLFFDFGVLNFEGREWSIKFQIYSVTGQDFYAHTRPTTLNGVDGIIFVLDSRKSHLEYNYRSWNDLKSMLGDTLYEIPLVVSCNKDDINDSEKCDIMEFLSNINYDKIKNFSNIKTIATKGIGILESFQNIVELIFPQVRIIN